MSKTEGKAHDNHDNLPGPHLIFTLTKRLLLGTYHGGVSPERLAPDLDEYMFRFNRRAMTPAGRAMRLLDRAIETLPITNRMILGQTKSST